MRFIKPSIFLLTMFLLTFCVRAGQDLSKEDAIITIENAWSALVTYAPMQGSYDVVDRESSSEGKFTIDYYNRLTAFQNAGLININKDPRFENYKKGQSFSWNDWFEQSQGDVRAKVVLQPTATGISYADPEEARLLKLPLGKFTVTDIIQNEPRQIGVDDLRLIKFKYNADWNQDYLKYSVARGHQLSSNRKAIALLKWDPFSSAWQIISEDVANLDAEFSTDNVADWLAGKKVLTGTSERAETIQLLNDTTAGKSGTTAVTPVGAVSVTKANAAQLLAPFAGIWKGNGKYKGVWKTVDCTIDIAIHTNAQLVWTATYEQGKKAKENYTIVSADQKGLTATYRDSSIWKLFLTMTTNDNRQAQITILEDHWIGDNQYGQKVYGTIWSNAYPIQRVSEYPTP